MLILHGLVSGVNEFLFVRIKEVLLPSIASGILEVNERLAQWVARVEEDHDVNPVASPEYESYKLLTATSKMLQDRNQPG